MAYSKTKDLFKLTQSDKVLKDKAFKIASISKYHGYQRGLVSMVYNFFDKKSVSLNRSKGSGILALLANKSANKPNCQLSSELHKPIIKKFEKRKIYSFFRDNIWGADLADMQSLRKYNKGIRYLLCAIDLFSKYACVIPIKDKKETSVVNAFQQILKESYRKPNKIWVDQGSEFYNNSFKYFLKTNNIEMYSTYNEGKLLLLKDLLEH